MATITLTFGPKTKDYTVSSQAVQRIQAWALANYPTIPNPAYTGRASTEPPTLPNPEPVISMMDGLIQGIKDGVKNQERFNAIQAIPAPADVT